MRLDQLGNAIAHPFSSYQISKAKRKHRKANPLCAVTGIKASFWGRNHDVHHRLPVHVRPDLACDPDNLITLCRDMHWMVGHCGTSWKDYNSNIDQTIVEIRAAYEATKVRVRDS
jgi:hypothetical protein